MRLGLFLVYYSFFIPKLVMGDRACLEILHPSYSSQRTMAY